ncbi:uncharacterized protein LOC114731348 [Neltuma alba]|uniref:uncharacterized protein LOC114731348 n=1 Tax=Neltuma alba TaxID=207710 RepID=UPI0010A3509B|nr:uncharacterized protein LOC114731348 [Prosopis alba]
MDVAGPSFRDNYNEGIEEMPNPNARAFYDMLHAAQQPLWEGCEESKLSATLQLLSIKATTNMSQQGYNLISQLIRRTQPKDTCMPTDLYQTKKLVSKLSLDYRKIDCCVNGCMLYYKADDSATQCKFCGEERYFSRRCHGRKKKVARKQLWFLPLIPRLQRLYASEKTAKEMTWHYTNRRGTNVLSHPSDGQAWKVFNSTYLDFAHDPRNVRLGLCADGFTLFGQSGRQYSCWPVIITPCNMSPELCMTQEYMFLTLIIPGPNNPKGKIDVYLQPLIDELKLLWDEGVLTYDASLRQNFHMRAALLWTINDFPAYGMLSGWMTMGRLSCSICMENSKAFQLKYGRKTSFFDCHHQFLPIDHRFRRNKNSFYNNRVEKSKPPSRLSGEEVWHRVQNLPKVTEYGTTIPTEGYNDIHHWTKQSIFWELPYWKSNLIRHNLDVMHIEKNVFENLFHTVMDTKGKTKDNTQARMDLQEYCRRKENELVDRGGKMMKPIAKYTLNLEQRKAIVQWIKKLKLPDGYASNLARCVDMKEARLYGMKSHDCHMFMERLVSIAFATLPDDVFNPVAELSQFFKQLCSTTLMVDQLEILEQNIVVTLCKLEKVFPPGFFDSMEHLPVHLAYEAKVGGPVQYRWMYPFKRFLYTLKQKVKNKARVEASICEAYIVEETAMFCSHYFEPGMPPRITRPLRNDDGGESNLPVISIFNHPGRPSGECKARFLNDEEVEAAKRYVLMNCDEVQPYMMLFVQTLKEDNCQITENEIESQINERFPSWFKNHVQNHNNNIVDPFLHDIAWGPKRKVRTWPMYFINGYKFHTHSWALRKSTINSGVCIKGADYAQSEHDFYGIVQEIIEIEYMGLPVKKLVLFNCEWFDPTPNRGTRVYQQYGIVEVHGLRRYNKYDPFIIAQQAMQVYYTSYPCCRQKANWLAAIKVKARNIIDAPTCAINLEAFQADGLEVILPAIIDDAELNNQINSEIFYEEVDMATENMVYEGDEYEDEVEEDEEDEYGEDEVEEDTDDGEEDFYIEVDDDDDNDDDDDINNNDEDG